jgi:hypothetical protein
VRIDYDDPFAPVFVVIGKIQAYAIPLLMGAIVALLLANIAPGNDEGGREGGREEEERGGESRRRNTLLVRLLMWHVCLCVQVPCESM